MRAGADAVYLGGQAFGARAKAKNFSPDELAAAVEYCHVRGVRVHVTVNTLLKENELPEALAFVKALCALPVDAVLVQDMGLFSLLRERAPELPIHASTQMSLHTPAGAALLRELGAVRVVLAREMSLGEIKAVSQRTPVELEAFVHGALCMSVSGQCYLSALLGGRSGNRGQCAQPCRLAFAAREGTGHDLSLKDLTFISHIDSLVRAGVQSVKIEGRMKRPEYVAAATAACRLAAGGEPVPPWLSQSLEAAFSRSGFTDGYLTGKRGRRMFGTRRKEDVAAATEKVYARLRGLYRGERQGISVRLKAGIRGKDVCLAVQDEEGRLAQTRQAAGESFLTKERCLQQLKKTGGTPFFPASVSLPEEGLPLALPALNAMRREALEKLAALRSSREPIPFRDIPLPAPVSQDKRGGPLPARAFFQRTGQLCPQARACREIVLPVETDLPVLRRLREEGWPPIFLEIPRAVFGWEEELRALLRDRLAAGFEDFVCGNLGALALCRELGARAHGSFSLNIANSAALGAFAALGLQSAELSFELSAKEASLAAKGALPTGFMVYGRQALMLTRNCPLANSPKGCLRCRTLGFLTDRMGVKFPVQCRMYGRGGVEMLNSVPLWLGDLQEELAWADFGALRFTVENAGQCGEVLERFFAGNGLSQGITRGLFRRGVE